jgi:hypothetical protein
MKKLQSLIVSTIPLVLLAAITAPQAAHAAIPAWLLEKLQNIKPQPAAMNPIIIPGWNKQQAQVLAETFITGKVDVVEAGIAESAMSEVGEYQGKKTPVMIASGNMAGKYPVGPYVLDEPKVRIVFDQNGNILKRDFVIPPGTCSSVETRMRDLGTPINGC